MLPMCFRPFSLSQQGPKEYLWSVWCIKESRVLAEGQELLQGSKSLMRA